MGRTATFLSGANSGTDHLLVQSKLEDRLEVGWLGVLAVPSDGGIEALWTGHEYVPPSPAHVAGWRLSQTQRYHVLRRGCGAGNALLLAQNRHRQEQQSVALLQHERADNRLSAAWAAERVIPPKEAGGHAWRLHHRDRYHVLGGGPGGGPIRVLARQHGEAGASCSSLGLLSFDEAKGRLVTAWIGGAVVPPRAAGAPAWLIGAGDRLQTLPPLCSSGLSALLVQNRDLGGTGRHRLAVLSSDPAGAGLIAEWSADGVLTGPEGARWRLQADDGCTVAGSLGGPGQCTLLIQGCGADRASVPSIAIVSLDACGRVFRLDAICGARCRPRAGTARPGD